MYAGVVLLFGQRADWSEFARSFENRPTGVIPLLMTLFLITMIVTVSVLYIMVRRREAREHFHDHGQLLEELCAAHGLDRSQRSLLKELAALAEVEHPDLLFVRPDQFEKAAILWNAQNSRRDSAPLEDLYRTLFAAVEQPTLPAESAAP